MFLQRQRTRQCPFCKRYMDCKILADHMQNCLSKDAGGNIESSSKSLRRFDLLKGRTQQCTICKHWMDTRVLVFHMWEYHRKEVEANHEEEANTVSETPTKKGRYESTTVDSDFEANCSTNHHLVEDGKGRYWVRCPICEHQQLSQEELINHCFHVHEDKYSIVQQRIFNSARKCELWKESIKKSHCTAWIETDRYRTDTQVVVLYRCSRVIGNGAHCDNLEEVGPGEVYSCTSFLKEHISDDGSVLVKYCTRHVAHELEVAELPFSKSDEEFIEDLIRQGLSMVAIRRKVRSHFGPTDRLHWITDGDIRNISARLDRRQDNLEFSNDASPGTSSTAENSQPPHVQLSVGAATLLEEGGVKNEVVSMNSNEESGHRSNESPIRGESLLQCPSCVKLSERMFELEDVVKRLSDRLMELEGSQVFVSNLKEERI
ncbi:hypothetical protein OSTOST_08119 [Ostertagia ostertagi]